MACYVVQRLVCYGSLWYVVRHMLWSVLRVMLCRYTCFTKCSRVIYCAVHCLGNCIAFPCFVALRCLALRCNKYVTLRYLMSFEVTLPCDTVRYLMSFEVTLPCDTVRYLMSSEVVAVWHSTLFDVIRSYVAVWYMLRFNMPRRDMVYYDTFWYGVFL